jgi:hypothetical protein
VAPPPISPPVEPTPALTTESRKHSEPPADADLPPLPRQRVVLLPHAQTKLTNTRPNTHPPNSPNRGIVARMHVHSRSWGLPRPDICDVYSLVSIRFSGGADCEQ